MHRHGLQSAGSRSVLAAVSQVSPSSSAPLLRRHRSGYAKPRAQTAQPRRPERLDDLTLMRNVTDRIVKHAAVGEKAAAWRSTPTPMGPEKRLRAVVHQVAQGSRNMQSLEKASYFAKPSAEDANFDDIPSFPSVEDIETGSMVEVRRGENCKHGVVLSYVYDMNRWRLCVFCSDGDMWTVPAEDVLFAIPGFCSHALVERCGERATAVTKVAHAARLDVLRRLRECERLVEDTYNGMANLMPPIYERVKASDPNQWGLTSVVDVANMLDYKAQSPLLTLFAVHKHLMNRELEYVARTDAYRTTMSFDVWPRAHIDVLKDVASMIRGRDSSLESFAVKARELITASQRRAQESFSEAPSNTEKHPTIEFTPEEQKYITVLGHSLTTKRYFQRNSYTIWTSAIVKKVDAYPDTILVDHAKVHRLLVDIGMLAPWQDLASRARALGLRQELDEHSPLVREQDALVRQFLDTRVAESTTSPPILSAPSGPEDFYATDPHESVRHDFGDMPVYVIDEPTAQELDDGLSYELIPSEPGSAWMHVHIADPTAIIPPTHTFAMHARRQSETAYFGHRTWPMLPPLLMREELSLGVKSAKGGKERVMTFSAKVDAQGQIVDYKIRAGLVKNMHVVTYAEVDRALSQEPPKILYPFGCREGMPSPADRVLTLAETEDLANLDKITARLVAARLRLPIFGFALAKHQTELVHKPALPTIADQARPTLYRGYPELVYSVPDVRSVERGSRRVVGEGMKAACRVASRFCRDHGLPAIRRTSGQMLTPTDEVFADLLSRRDDVGMVDSVHLFASGATAQAAEYTLEPAEHWALGIPHGEGYVRVTSPLRRYEDLVAHWQIKSALLPPSAPAAQAVSAFSADWMKDCMTHLALARRSFRGAEHTHRRFWAFNFIQRWIDNPSRPGRESGRGLLDNMAAAVMGEAYYDSFANEEYQKVYIPELGFTVPMYGYTSRAQLPISSAVRVSVREIRIGTEPWLSVDKL